MSLWLGKILKFMVFRLPKNVFATQKLEKWTFLLMFSSKILPQVHIITTHTHKHTHANLFLRKLFLTWYISKAWNNAKKKKEKKWINICDYGTWRFYDSCLHINSRTIFWFFFNCFHTTFYTTTCDILGGIICIKVSDISGNCSQ